MKIGGGDKEKGIEIGNVYNKYESKNPIVKFLMGRFHRALDELVSQAKPSSIHEIGCGEGYWVFHWQDMGIAARGSDVSERVIAIAKNNGDAQGRPTDNFQVRDIYDVSAPDDSAELIVCCEVLEHLENPERALEALRGIASRYIVLSVPREPIWRLMNMARMKYLNNLGNTPGHIQHWSSGGFRRLVERYFVVIEERRPIPWTMLLAKRR